MIKSDNVKILFKTTESTVEVDCSNLKLNIYSTIPGKKFNFIKFKMEELDKFDLENQLPITQVVTGIEIKTQEGLLIGSFSVNNQHPQYTINCTDSLIKSLEFEIE